MDISLFTESHIIGKHDYIRRFMFSLHFLCPNGGKHGSATILIENIIEHYKLQKWNTKTN